MRPSRVLVVLVILAAGAVFLALRAALDAEVPATSDEQGEPAAVEGGRIRLVGKASTEPDARLEAWFRDLQGEHLAGVARTRLKDEIRQMAAADPGILERLAALARLSPAEQQAAGVNRGNVLLALSFLGPAGAEALADVGVSGPGASELGGGFQALLTLGGMREEAAAATPILLTALHDEARRDRWFILRILSQIGPGAGEAVPFLQGVLRPPVDDGLAGGAALALVRIQGATEDTLTTLRAAILDEETMSRAGVIRALAECGPDGAALAPDLLPLLDDIEGSVRGAAAEALGRMGVSSPEIVSALLALLEVEHNPSAVAALGTLGPTGLGALDHLARSGEEASDRLVGLKGLVAAKADLRPLEGVILGVLESDHADAWRQTALDVFARMTPPPEGNDVLDALVRTLDVEPLSLGAARALVNMARPESTERLLAWVARSAGSRPGLVAAAALWEAGKDVPGTTDLVIEALGATDDPSLRSWAWSLLARDQAHARPADVLPLYDRCLEDEATSAQTKWRALVAVAALDGAEDAVFSRLLAGLDVREVRAAAAAALIERPKRASESVPALLDALARAADREMYTPWQFWSALDALGPKWSGTREALDALIADASMNAHPDLAYVRDRLFPE